VLVLPSRYPDLITSSTVRHSITDTGVPGLLPAIRSASVCAASKVACRFFGLDPLILITVQKCSIRSAGRFGGVCAGPFTVLPSSRVSTGTGPPFGAARFRETFRFGCLLLKRRDPEPQHGLPALDIETYLLIKHITNG
jgi:hypothetical protein